MVVVGGTAHSVDRFTVFPENHVDVTSSTERLQGSIDSGQSHAVTTIFEVLVDFLRGAKVIELGKSRCNRGALLGRPDAKRTHGMNFSAADHDCGDHRCGRGRDGAPAAEVVRTHRYRAAPPSHRRW